MASPSADTADADVAAAREARIAVKTDAMCLKHMLIWARRGFQALPFVLILTYFAFKDGAGLWAVAWLAL